MFATRAEGKGQSRLVKKKSISLSYVLIPNTFRVSKVLNYIRYTYVNVFCFVFLHKYSIATNSRFVLPTYPDWFKNDLNFP